MAKEWAKSFYNSDRWKQCRETFMESKGWLCERCSTPDDPVIAAIAHHKEYLTPSNINDPYITLCAENLEALCQTCHNIEHHEEETEVRYMFDSKGNIAPKDN